MHSISVDTTVLVVRFIFCLINRDVCSQKSNFKLRFLGNNLYVCDKHSADFFSSSSFHETKKEQIAELEIAGPLFPTSNFSSTVSFSSLL